MTVGSRTRRAIADPHAVLPFLSEKLSVAAVLARRRRFGPLVGYLVAEVAGTDPYTAYLRLRSPDPDGLVRRTVNGAEMWLDPSDAGLSRDVLLHGVREPETVAAFRRELRDLRETVDGPLTVLDVGANIGYYALLEAGVVGDAGTVFAFEPSPDNFDLLQRNVALNGFEGRIETVRKGVGAADRRATLHLSTHSNLHKMHESSFRDLGRSVDIDLVSIDSFLDERGVDPASVNSLRRDLEGHETAVIEGMESVLRAESPLVICLEMHPNILDGAEVQGLLSTFRAHGFELVCAVRELHAARESTRYDVSSLAELSVLDELAYNLIVRR